MSITKKLEQLCGEAWPLANMWWSAQKAKVLPKDSELATCYDLLNKVSRSFAIVIQELPEDLRDSVCIFYLVLRALDTVEDDMAISTQEKLPVLQHFHEHIHDRNWSMRCGTKEYAELMKLYPTVTAVFLDLPKLHQKIIGEIAQRMAAGMAEFIQREVESVRDYDLYCHYVAGLVGIGLSQLFAASSHESNEFASMERLSNGMGLFLQKTNIIRDYLEDIMEEPAPRMFWPKEIWGLYGMKLEQFKDPANCGAATKALNHMVTDALRHALDSLDYMSKLQNRQVFRFCAVPQVMAIGTLAEIYNNPRVFTGVVKLRRGVVARYMLGLNSYSDLLRAFLHFSSIIAHRCHSEASNDPNALHTSERAEAIVSRCSDALKQARQPLATTFNLSTAALRFALLLLVVYFLSQRILQQGSLVLSAMQIVLTAPVVLFASILIYSSSMRV